MATSDVIELAASWAVTTTATFLVVLVDERRLPREALARAWPPASRDAAIVGFGPLALVVHFAKTRGHMRSGRGVLGLAAGLALGLVATAVVLVASALVLEGVALALGLP